MNGRANGDYLVERSSRAGAAGAASRVLTQSSRSRSIGSILTTNAVHVTHPYSHIASVHGTDSILILSAHANKKQPVPIASNTVTPMSCGQLRAETSQWSPAIIRELAASVEAQIPNHQNGDLTRATRPSATTRGIAFRRLPDTQYTVELQSINMSSQVL